MHGRMFLFLSLCYFSIAVIYVVDPSCLAFKPERACKLGILPAAASMVFVGCNGVLALSLLYCYEYDRACALARLCMLPHFDVEPLPSNIKERHVIRPGFIRSLHLCYSFLSDIAVFNVHGISCEPCPSDPSCLQ